MWLAKRSDWNPGGVCLPPKATPLTTPHTLAFHCTLVLTRGIQGLGVEIHWGLSRRVPWVRVGRHHHPPGVEAQRLGVVWVEGVMQIDDGGYASCQSCILYICSWQRQRPDCTGAAEQTRTHSLQGKTHPDRRPERGGPSVHMTSFRPGPFLRMDAWSCHCHTGPLGSPSTHGSLGAHSDQRLSWSVHMRSIPPRAPLLNAPPHPQPTLPPESILHTLMP